MPDKYRKPRPTLPWWGHVIVLTLMVAGVVATIGTGNRLYVLVLVAAAWSIGWAISYHAWRRMVSS